MLIGIRLACLAYLALVSPAAQDPACHCNPTCTLGPDIIVGNLTGPANYQPVGQIDALSIGTDACNIGDVWANWMDYNPDGSYSNQHPVICGNLYKYSVVNGAGRFEQIGLSWMKHGFYAESNNTCCTDCNGDPTGNHLGVHCSDPYTAGRNGDRTLMGPRWQVNAHTGVFPYPEDDPPYHGSAARRVEVDTAELIDSSASTVRYFGEAQYITQDDATASNQNNNCSYREIMATLVSGSNWDFNFVQGSTTQRTLQAIRAWPLVDPGAHLASVQVTNGGLYIVGSHATAIGGGHYHYEYAVYNMNDDSNAGSFSVPVPPSAHITNVGFHDVTYRDGDGPGDVNFDGTDWPVLPSTTVNRIMWATTPYAQNQSANAIRFGTLYNFRFDADTAPVSGQARVGLWATPSVFFSATADVPGP